MYTLPLVRHSALTVVRQKYLVTFFRCLPHLQLILQRCYLYTFLCCNSSLFHFTYFCRCDLYYNVVIYISSYVVDAGMMMKQSVLCLNVIDQHYLNFHLPAERDTVTFTFDTLFIYF